MKKIEQAFLTGERALFGASHLSVEHTIFDDGESPLKESHHIEIADSMFKWKYPLWYSKHIKVKDSVWFEMARAGVWYTEDIEVTDCIVEAPKNFRRCRNLRLKNVSFPNAAETMWHCCDARMENIYAKGNYFAMNSINMSIDRLELVGDYSFDGCENMEIHHAKMLSKDAFWNSNHITVYDSFISGEYLGWNAKNLTLVNCTIESLQGMCYIENLVMKNCRLINTTLAFEYSTVEAEITGKIDSVINPKSGTIKADRIETLIMEKDKIDPAKTVIICRASEDETTVPGHEPSGEKAEADSRQRKED